MPILFAWAASALAQGSAPTITSQPLSLTNNARTTAVFTVGVGGTSPFAYQWRKNGTALAAATASSLVLSNVLAANQGSYSVVVTNSSGSATSTAAKLTVIDPVILVQPYTYDATWQIIHTNAVAVGDYADFRVNAVGTEPLSYQWKFRRVGGLTPVNLTGETSDMLLISSVQEGDAGSYSVLVESGSGGKVTSSNGVLTLLVPPKITTQPQTQVAVAGTDVTLSVRVTGTTPMSYQWLKDLNVIPGATNADLTLTNVGLLDAGNYVAEISNVAGYTNSSVATLTVNVPPIILNQPDDQTVVEGDDLVDFDVVIDPDSTDPLVFQWYFNGRIISGATDSTYTIVHIINPGPNQEEDYTVYLSDAGTYQARIQNAGGTVFSSNAILTVLVPPKIVRQSVSQAVWTNTYASFAVTVDATSTPPLSYQWFFDNSGGLNYPVAIPGATATNLTFLVTNQSQYGAYSCEISNIVDTTNTDDAILTVIQETTKPTLTLVSPTNYATWTEPMITVQGTAADNLGVRAVQFYANDDFSTTNFATTTNGWTNWVATFPAGIGTNTFQAEAFDTSGNKSVLTTKRYIIRLVSDRVTVAVNPPGAGTVSGVTNGQWLVINSNYTATASVYSALDYAFTNWARATNGTSWTTSSAPALSFAMQSNLTLQANFVPKPPSISAQPQNLTAIAGQNATFAISVAGAAPLSYQWRFNSVNIAGATGTNYAVINAQPTNAGTYSVVVTNVAGSATSSNATLTVLVTAAITNQPQSLTVFEGQSAPFSVAAVGTAPLSYQWRFNGVNIAGATGTGYSVVNARSTNAGTYSVVVTNVAGGVTSSNATLTVIVPPTITNQPRNLTVVIGQNATFTVSAAGTAPLSYQWRFNSVNIAGATGTNYSVVNAQPTNAGSYSVVVTNAAGSATSPAARLIVAGPAVSISLDATKVTLSFVGMTGFNYTLEYKNALEDPLWGSIPPSVAGTGSLLMLQDARRFSGERFYRVRCE